MRVRAVCAILAVTMAAAPSASAQAPVYPEVGEGTSFLDHRAVLAGFAEREWYEANIPFIDVPDRQIQDVYYYRWRVHKEALKYTTPDDGYIVTEFLGPVGYAAPYGGIVAAAGHHVYEGRWIRDRRYLDDYVDYWLRGPGGRFATRWQVTPDERLTPGTSWPVVAAAEFGPPPRRATAHSRSYLDRSISVPGVDLSDPATRAGYRFMFGLRGDPGSISVDRFEARCAGC